MQIDAMTTGPNPARRLPRLRRGNVFTLLQTLALAVVVAGCAATATPRVDESELLAQGFKVLVATTTVQKEWVQTLPPGQIRPMQRNDKKYYISSVPTFSEENQLERLRIGLRLGGGPCKQLIYRGRLEHGHAQDL